jgi:hypothetical protein
MMMQPYTCKYKRIYTYINTYIGMARGDRQVMIAGLGVQGVNANNVKFAGIGLTLVNDDDATLQNAQYISV